MPAITLQEKSLLISHAPHIDGCVDAGIISASPLMHLAKSLGIGNEKAEFGMFTSYYDAAGGKDHGFIVVAGWVSTLGQWERLAVDWRLALVRAGITYFSMKECAHSKKEFKSWKDKEGERDNLLRTLADIICSYVQFGTATYVEFDGFARVNESYCLKEWIGNPYSLAGRDCAKESTKWALQQLRHSHATPVLPLKHIFEDGDKGKGLLLSLMEKDRYPTPSFEPKKDTVKITYPEKLKYIVQGVVQLQTSDFAAYESRKAKPLLEINACLERHRKSMQALVEVPTVRSIYRESDLVKFCKDYGVPKRITGERCPSRL